MTLTRIGYWLDETSPGWPDPRLLVDPAWDDDERAEVASYLRRGFVARRYLGPSMCRICGEAVGSLELTDMTFLWPEGLAHYVTEHSVRLPPRLIEHIRTRTREIEDAAVDEDWWRSQAQR